MSPEFRLILVMVLILVGIAGVMWKIMRTHYVDQRRVFTSISQAKYRKKLAHIGKSAPKIVLLSIHLPTDDTKLAAHCFFNNVVTNPLLSGRIIPVFLKLGSEDTNTKTPAYSYCKHGHHDGCYLYSDTASLLGKEHCMDTMLCTICVHCPRFSSDQKTSTIPTGYMADQLIAMQYGLKHLEDTGVAYDYVCMVPATVCLSFAWDETLINELSKMHHKAEWRDPEGCIIVSQSQTLEDCTQRLNEYRTSLASLTTAQMDRHNHQALNSPSPMTLTSESRSFVMALSGGESSRIEQYQSLCRLAAGSNTSSSSFTQRASRSRGGSEIHLSAGRNLATILWDSKIPADWYGIERNMEVNQYEFLKKPYEFCKVGNDTSPSLTPWWSYSSIVFMPCGSVQKLLSSFATLLVVDDFVPINDFEWSLACYSNNFIFASPLQCIAVSFTRRAEDTTVSIIREPLTRFVDDNINRRRLYELNGVGLETFSANHNESTPIRFTSADAKLGLVNLSAHHLCDGERQVQALHAIKNHDILCRFGSYASYYAYRGR